MCIPGTASCTAGHIDVVVAVEVGMDTALQTHLGSACLGGLDRAICDVLEFEQIRGATEVQRQRTLGEAAKAALERAHIGVVDVAVGDPGDNITDDLLAQLIRDLGDGGNLAAAARRVSASRRIRRLARPHTVEDLLDGSGRQRFARNQGLGSAPVRRTTGY